MERKRGAKGGAGEGRPDKNENGKSSGEARQAAKKGKFAKTVRSGNRVEKRDAATIPIPEQPMPKR